MPFPERIACVGGQTPELLARLGAADRIVTTFADGDSGDAPPQIVEDVRAARPDLVIVSGGHVHLASHLRSAACDVLLFAPDTLAALLQQISDIGERLGCASEARHLRGNLEQGLLGIQVGAGRLPCSPRVLVEVSDQPVQPGPIWLDEVVARAGGRPVTRPDASAGLRSSEEALAAGMPDVIVAAWPSARLKKTEIAGRAGWQAVPAIERGAVFWMDPRLAQPGPAALTEGVRQIYAMLCRATGTALEPALAPEEPWDS